MGSGQGGSARRRAAAQVPGPVTAPVVRAGGPLPQPRPPAEVRGRRQAARGRQHRAGDRREVPGAAAGRPLRDGAGRVRGDAEDPVRGRERPYQRHRQRHRHEGPRGVPAARPRREGPPDHNGGPSAQGVLRRAGPPPGDMGKRAGGCRHRGPRLAAAGPQLRGGAGAALVPARTGWQGARHDRHRRRPPAEPRPAPGRIRHRHRAHSRGRGGERTLPPQPAPRARAERGDARHHGAERELGHADHLPGLAGVDATLGGAPDRRDHGAARELGPFMGQDQPRRHEPREGSPGRRRAVPVGGGRCRPGRAGREAEPVGGHGQLVFPLPAPRTSDGWRRTRSSS